MTHPAAEAATKVARKNGYSVVRKWDKKKQTITLKLTKVR